MSQDFFGLTAHEIRDSVRSGAASAVDVTRSYLSRIDAVDVSVQAYSDVWRESALEQAADIDSRISSGEDVGPLAGVPVGLKDNFCTLRGKTQCGSKILEGFESPYNATAVKRLEAAGCVFLGKMNMDEFAMGSSTENSAFEKTKNPWNLACVPGGSSGGPAAGVAADEAAFSLGSDTGGSIRQPASLCGCIGMKPTYGRVSRYGLVAFASSLDQIGPFTKDVEDLTLILNVISGRDSMDSTSAAMEVPDYTEYLTNDVAGMTVGLPKEYFTEALGSEVREKIDAAVDVLKDRGAKVVEVSLPHTEHSIAVCYIVATAEASANLARFDGVRYGFRHKDASNVEELYALSKSEGFGTEVQRRIMLGTYVLSSGYYDAYYGKAQKVRALIRRDFDEAFQNCDVIVTPTSPSAAFRAGEKIDDPLQMYLSDIYTSSANLAGIPGVSIPCGLTEAKLPVGLQILGKPFSEGTLIRVAYAYEQNSGLSMGKPPIT